ncbi:microvirus H family protein, partial [Chlamydia psittaci 99DC5]
MVDAGFENQKELTKMQLDNQKEIAEMQNETQKEIAGIQSATSRQNTKDQVYAQNEMLAYQQKESTARVASIMENTNLSKQQQVSEIMRQMLTQAQTAGQYFTNDQIKEMTRKVSAEVDLVHQQTQNQRYGSSHIGATAKDISNVVTDAASGVVDIFHGIDKAVADTWNNFWKDGKADGIG